MNTPQIIVSDRPPWFLTHLWGAHRNRQAPRVLPEGLIELVNKLDKRNRASDQCRVAGLSSPPPALATIKTRTIPPPPRLPLDVVLVPISD